MYEKSFSSIDKNITEKVINYTQKSQILHFLKFGKNEKETHDFRVSLDELDKKRKAT